MINKFRVEIGVYNTLKNAMNRAPLGGHGERTRALGDDQHHHGQHPLSQHIPAGSLAPMPPMIMMVLLLVPVQVLPIIGAAEAMITIIVVAQQHDADACPSALTEITVGRADERLCRSEPIRARPSAGGIACRTGLPPRRFVDFGLPHPVGPSSTRWDTVRSRAA